MAVIAVVGFHAFPQGVRGGFVGVDIFFVISGFLISTIILQKLATGTFDFAHFYARRIRRLFPALALVLTACLAAGWVGMADDEFRQLGKHASAAAGFVSNFYYWQESGYFDSAAYTKPLLHTWSLGIEEQYYIVWPLLLWVSARLGARMLVVMSVVALASFVANIAVVNTDGALAYYSPWTRFWELAIGSLLAQFTLARAAAGSEVRWAGEARSILGLVLIAVAVALTSKDESFPGWWALLPTLGAALVISSRQSWFNRKFLANPVMVHVGLISYPLYLWHWPVLVFLRLSEVDNPSRDARMLAVVASLALAWATFRWIERPLANRRDTRLVPLLVAGMLAILAFGLASYQNGGFKNRNAEAGYTLNQGVMDSFADWKYTSNRLCTNRYPFEASKNYATWFCMQSDDREPTLVLLGSSYANQLYPGFAKNPALAGHTVLSIGMCDPAKVDELPLESVKDVNPCVGRNLANQQKFYEKLIDQHRSIKYVILDGLKRDPDEAYIARIRQRIDFLEARGIAVVVFGPHLRLGFNPRACFTTPMRTASRDCTFSLLERNRIEEQFKPLVESIAKTNQKVRFFWQNDIYCNAENCSMVRDGLPLARDYGHITELGAVRLQEHFTHWALENLPSILEAPRRPGK